MSELENLPIWAGRETGPIRTRGAEPPPIDDLFDGGFGDSAAEAPPNRNQWASPTTAGPTRRQAPRPRSTPKQPTPTQSTSARTAPTRTTPSQTGGKRDTPLKHPPKVTVVSTPTPTPKAPTATHRSQQLLAGVLVLGVAVSAVYSVWRVVVTPNDETDRPEIAAVTSAPESEFTNELIEDDANLSNYVGETSAAAIPTDSVTISRLNRSLLLSGVVESNDIRASLVDQAAQVYGGDNVTDQLSVDPDTYTTVDLAHLSDMIQALVPVESYDIRLDDDSFHFVTTAGIQFAADSAELTGEASAAVDAIAKLAAGTNLTVQIDGYANDGPDESTNRLLSLSRATAVADRLSSGGVGESQLNIAGYGSIEAQTDVDDIPNQRVVISADQ